MQLTKIFLRDFTVFHEIDIDLCPGINVFSGHNGLGKTHLLQVAYATCMAARPDADIHDLLVNIFRPMDGKVSRLIQRSGHKSWTGGPQQASIMVQSDAPTKFRCTISSSNATNVVLSEDWYKQKIDAVFVPSKDVLAHAPGFISLYNMREVSYSQVYHDILIKAFRFPLRMGATTKQQAVIEMLSGPNGMNGEAGIQSEHFSLQRPNGNKVEWSMLSHAEQKLGLLWQLMQRGCLEPGSILFWDEPGIGFDSPRIRLLADILFALRKTGVQILLATHNQLLMKELHDQVPGQCLSCSNDAIQYNMMFKKYGRIKVASH